MSYRIVFFILSKVFMLLSLFLGISAVVSFIYQEDLRGLLFTFFLTFLTGGVLFFITKGARHEELRYKEAFLTVTLTWLGASFFGALPYIFTGSIASITDACFESMAGFTTTGASILKDVESLPRGILFWRSLTQWIGGIGIVVFVLAVLPVIGTGGMQLFKAEVPGISVDKIRPRLVDTAKLLSILYLTLTGLIGVVYHLLGMDLFDAVCHAFTTISTGGFSTKNSSIGHFNSAGLEYAVSVCMLLGSINFTLYFHLLKGNFRDLLKNEELRFYLGVVSISVVLMWLYLMFSFSYSMEKAFRETLFQVVSIITTTGYSTADYTLWGSFAQGLILFIMFLGGMVGSTAGGIKELRIYLMFKELYHQFLRMIHPRAVTVLKLREKNVSIEILETVWIFVFLTITVWIGASLMISAIGVDLVTALSTVASCLNNVGPALGEAGPASNYAEIPVIGKWVLIACMLIGRLEYFTVLVLFVPAFWKK